MGCRDSGVKTGTALAMALCFQYRTLNASIPRASDCSNNAHVRVFRGSSSTISKTALGGET